LDVRSETDFATKTSDFDLAVRQVENWIVQRMFEDISLTDVFTELSQKIDRTLFPLVRSHVTMRQMHPFIDHTDHTWNRTGELLTNSRPRTQVAEPNWTQSPLFYMIENVIDEYRCDLTSDEVVRRFPIFTEFKAIGGTDYLAILTPFGNQETAIKQQDGIISSWLTDRKDGFTDREIRALKRLVNLFHATARIFKREQTLQDVLSAYLGPVAARQVMEGKNQRGDGDVIQAVIWICDLRGSSALADQMEMAEYLTLVNQFFESMAEAVMAEGGEVLKFMGDGFLAIFPTSDRAGIADAAQRALKAARDGAASLARHPSEASKLQFGVGIHHGDVMFGNIGATERLDFSVIGPAVNMASRLQDLTKTLDASLLVSSAIADHLPIDWRRFPQQSVPGLKDPIDAFTPA
jgi:adenylate cyclase